LIEAIGHENRGAEPALLSQSVSRECRPNARSLPVPNSPVSWQNAAGDDAYEGHQPQSGRHQFVAWLRWT